MNPCLAWAVLFSMTVIARAASNEPVVPIVPTVFFLSREVNPYRVSDAEVPTMANVGKIVEAARKILRLEPNLSEHFENIIILDEGDSWFVSFLARGNGNVRFSKLTPTLATTDATGYFMINTNVGVYLSKNGLTRAEHGPAVPIRSLPLISPMGERVRGLGLVVEPGDK
jgi:hypothetical protein